MKKLNKNDKVKIINTDSIWKDKIGTVINQDDDELFDESNLDITNVKVKVNLIDSENSNHLVIQNFPRYMLEIITDENCITNTKDELNENLNINYIKSYLYEETVNSYKPSYFSISKIALAEDLSEKQVLEDAKKFNYKVCKISNKKYDKVIILAPEYSIKSLYEYYNTYEDKYLDIKEI